jgi:hypothetical protein
VRGRLPLLAHRAFDAYELAHTWPIEVFGQQRAGLKGSLFYATVAFAVGDRLGEVSLPPILGIGGKRPA